VQQCEQDVSAAVPPLLKVLQELRAIDKSSIAELKVGCLCSMNSPQDTGGATGLLWEAAVLPQLSDAGGGAIVCRAMCQCANVGVRFEGNL